MKSYMKKFQVLLLVLLATSYMNCSVQVPDDAGTDGGTGTGTGGGSGTAEGTYGAPMVITMPHNGTVDDYYGSYYRINGLIAGHNYTISMTNLSDDADLYVSGADSTFNADVCTTDPRNFGTTSESCGFDATATYAYIEIDGYWTASGASFTLSIVDNGAGTGGGGTAEGTYASPLSITLPHNGTVGTTASYYIVSGLTVGNSYTINMTGLTDDADLYVYGADNTFTTVVCASGSFALFGTASENCTFTANAGYTYIEIDGAWTVNGTSFTLSW